MPSCLHVADTVPVPRKTRIQTTLHVKMHENEAGTRSGYSKRVLKAGTQSGYSKRVERKTGRNLICSTASPRPTFNETVAAERTGRPRYNRAIDGH